MVALARALVVLGAATMLALLTGGGTAYAACGVGPDYDATRLGQLRSVALGSGVPGDVAFVGTIVGRGAAFKSGPSVYTPITFAVAVGIRGVHTRRLTLLTEGGTVNGLTTTVEDAPSYRPTGLNLVLANRAPDGSFLDAGGCQPLAGSVSLGEVRTLVRLAVAPVILDARFQSSLVFTGSNTSLKAASGAFMLLLGALLVALGTRPQAHGRVGADSSVRARR